MEALLFLRGVAIGLALAAPIGPVGILCIRKALADGRTAAFVAAMGAALADALFGAAAGLGLGLVTDLLDGWLPALKAVGGLFMLALGFSTWRSAAIVVEADGVRGPGVWRDFASTFAITITNPGTILGAMGVFAGFGAAVRPEGGLQAWLLVTGVFAGSTLWWLVLSALAAAARSRFTPERMRRFNHGSGGLVMLFGAGALASLAW